MLYGMNEQTDRWLRSWILEVTHANWKHGNDVLRQFPQANKVADNVFQFRVALQSEWIEVSIMFPLAVAIVIDLKRIN